jgi:hypothetical protein
MSSLSIAAGIVIAIAAVGMVATDGTAAASVTAAASREMPECLWRWSRDAACEDAIETSSPRNI